MPALAGQQHLNGPHLGGGNQPPMMPRVSGLGARSAPAFALSTTGPLVASQSVGGRWFRGIGRILFPQRQLPLQIGDLLLRVGNLLLRVGNLLGAFDNLSLALGYLTAEFVVLALEALIIPVQLLPARLVRMPIAIRRPLLSSCAASCPRTHPPYVKRFAAICPAKSRLVRELLRYPFVDQEYRRSKGAMKSLGRARVHDAAGRDPHEDKSVGAQGQVGGGCCCWSGALLCSL